MGDPSFFIKSSDNAFTDRQKNIFDQLNLVDRAKNSNSVQNEAETDRLISADVNEGVSTVASIRRNRRETKQFRGKESIFKRPEALPPRFKARDIPDYQRRPDKWIKYSLADVSNDDMSERSNTATAMAFLEEIASRKSNTSMSDDKDCEKIEFKPRKKTEELLISVPGCGSNEDEEKGSFRSSKLVMPEYVVGREKKKRDLKRANKSTGSDKKFKEIKLAHLDEEDE